jgi:hypothetical protein
VFVANGDSDPMILPHYSYLLAGLIPQARVKIYPDSAHAFLFQHDADFAADVEAFLSEPPGSRLGTCYAARRSCWHSQGRQRHSLGNGTWLHGPMIALLSTDGPRVRDPARETRSARLIDRQRSRLTVPFLGAGAPRAAALARPTLVTTRYFALPTECPQGADRAPHGSPAARSASRHRQRSRLPR